ncbi:Inner membrane protein [Streptomyces albus]|uniref:Inner membrane protein n=1 Tax=Streptomyces albus (strain ATCC 21838 / DSM 41398 / FERM P-419 / JCM 4703 / NBRC 107858) TaxID=1081613 RepID=A0A0B5EVS5_STRA4|nr:Inner membrane protein [Streptomyces albus]AOU76549.1 Inner membrane protein [Streptomyces albus]AYN32332.1 Inner membrane protein [Streptomyces albus]
MELTLLYRGPLASCDYDCPYCPFAKRRDAPAQLRHDRACLERFADWAEAATGDELSLLFTPWGEGLVRSWYRTTLARLSRLPHLRRVAIQTNLSCRTDWLADADPDTLALWCTFHPGQTPYDRFLGKCRELAAGGVRFSVGVVGLPEHLAAARQLRTELPEHVYLWINAAEGHGYTDEEAARWTALDPLFPYSRHPHRSAGLPCRTGASVVSVDGEGTVRRCHFVPGALGNLYDGSYRAALRPRPCPLAVCDCHIGYVHLESLPLYDVFAGGVLERIPARIPAMPPLPIQGRAISAQTVLRGGGPEVTPQSSASASTSSSPRPDSASGSSASPG